MNQIIIICLAIISLSSIYLIYQNIQVISSFNKLTINLNKINENLVHQGQLIRTGSGSTNSNNTPIKHPNVPSNTNPTTSSNNQTEISQTNNIRNQYDNYNPAYMETDSNISDKEVESDQNNEVEETQNAGYDIPEELKHQIENLEEYDEEDELNNNYVENTELSSENNDVPKNNNESEFGETEQNNEQNNEQSTPYLDTNCDTDGLESSEKCNDSISNKLPEELEDLESPLPAEDPLLLPEDPLLLAEEPLHIDETILDTNTHNFESYTKENLEKLTLIELKQLARENHLKVKGKKIELIDRVLNKFQQ